MNFGAITFTVGNYANTPAEPLESTSQNTGLSFAQGLKKTIPPAQDYNSQITRQKKNRSVVNTDVDNYYLEYCSGTGSCFETCSPLENRHNQLKKAYILPDMGTVTADNIPDLIQHIGFTVDQKNHIECGSTYRLSKPDSSYKLFLKTSFASDYGDYGQDLNAALVDSPEVIGIEFAIFRNRDKYTFLTNDDFEFVSREDGKSILNPFESDGFEYYGVAMEYAAGSTLEDTFKTRQPFSIKEAVELAYKISRGLYQIHQQGIIHQDIKPDNIVYNEETGMLKIIDFGMSTLNDYCDVYHGCHEYMAPELSFSETEGRVPRHDKKCDSWGLGMTMLTVICGSLPGDFNFPSRFPYSCPANNHLFSQEQEETKRNAINSTLKTLGYDPSKYKELVSIILQLIAHDPAERMSVEDAFINLEALQLKINRKFGVK